MRAVSREELRGEALATWGWLEELLGVADAHGDALVVPPLLEAQATVLRLGRVLARRRRRSLRVVIWPDDVAMVQRHLDEMATHVASAPLSRDREVADLLAAARASVARLGELVAERRR